MINLICFLPIRRLVKTLCAWQKGSVVLVSNLAIGIFYPRLIVVY